MRELVPMTTNTLTPDLLQRMDAQRVAGANLT